MTTKPEELPFLCIVQSQQNVRILANPTDKVLHVDIEIEAGYFLWLFILFQQHLEAGKTSYYTSYMCTEAVIRCSNFRTEH